jgi:hypothetical protein
MSYKHPHKRLALRGAHGRFRQPVMERDFGLKVLVCQHCRGCNPVGVRDALPTSCCQCGKDVAEDQWE